MPNPLFNAMQNNNTSNLLGMVQQIKSNPVQFLASRGINVPQNIANNPQAIVQNLLNSGRMSQQQFNNLSNMVRGMK